MTETGLSTGKIPILVAEAHADAPSEAAEGPDIAGGGLPFGGMGEKPHQASPSALLELPRPFGHIVPPGQGHRMKPQVQGGGDAT